MIELKELLKTLVSLLNQDGLKSKQAAFNLCYDDLAQAKEMASWDVIARHVNENTSELLTAQIASNMFQRAKAKKKKQTKKRVISVKETKQVSEKVDKDDHNESENTISDGLLEKYMKVCFNKEMIARNAIENNISIDLIQQWGCANFVQLNNAIGNYIRHK
ncbi:hypothetical protein [Citrobacter sp. NCU1]|uniref:hypothetical protein n=1 Tax=Citrobacter sp. NCU1 TaxID=2026683 RepID=UPI0013908176|nr:hypothetical protein [Citrobacter sp. NCU1]